MTPKPKLSIVILSHNTKELLKNCLESINKNKDEADLEVIVSDNASTDGSREVVKSQFPWVKLIENEENLGFAAGNNKARNIVSGEYVLILNSDTQIKRRVFKESLKYLANHPEAGALTCKLLLQDGKLDPDTRRSFPTPWVTFSHFLKLDLIFPKSGFFARYWYGYKSPEEIQEVDVIQGAFTLARKKVLDDIDWYDEDYFLDGEDIDLCWKIKEKGLKVIYYPKVSIVHYKKGTKLKVKSLRNIMAGVDSMEIFYKKHLWSKYPIFINLPVLLGIKVIKVLRFIKFYLQ